MKKNLFTRPVRTGRKKVPRRAGEVPKKIKLDFRQRQAGMAVEERLEALFDRRRRWPKW